MRSILLLLFFAASIGSISAQPSEFTLPCSANPLEQAQFFGEIKINGANAAVGDWVALIDDVGNVIGIGAVSEVVIGMTLTTIVVFAAAEEPSSNPACPAGFGGFDDAANDANDEVIDIVLWDQSSGSFLTTATTVSFDVDPAFNIVIGADGNALTADLYDFVMPFAPLPVELTYFRGQPKETGVLLDWATATEIDNDFFEIEHSLDGRSFTAVGQVDGVGTSDVEQRYEFMHNSPGAGLNYYRLKQVDFDGSYAYSDIETVNFFRAGDQDNEVRLFPNPAQGQVQISIPGIWEEGDVDIRIRDLNGRILQQLQMGISPTLDIDVTNLPTGFYLVELSNGQEVEIARLVKQ